MDSSQSVDAATHVTDRVLYRRLVEIGVDAEESMRIMAFWMWVEAQGFIELVPKISANNDQLLAMVADETKAILAALDPSSTTPITQNLCPITSLILYPVSVEEIFGDKDLVSEGVSEVHNQVCGVLFKDVFEEGDKSGKTESSVTEVGEGSGKDGNEGSGKTLNPFAKEWDPAVERAPEEDRKYGPCVERVYVHKPDPNAPALFGKIVFNTALVTTMIMSTLHQAKFNVEGKPLWCKRFDLSKKHGGEQK
nr:hypothetical protein CFP56_65733 [Quercus suber]